MQFVDFSGLQYYDTKLKASLANKTHSYTTAASAAKNWYRIANASISPIDTTKPLHVQFRMRAYNSAAGVGYWQTWFVDAEISGQTSGIHVLGESGAPFSQIRVLYENTAASVTTSIRPALDIYLNYVLTNATVIEIEELNNSGFDFVADGALAASTVPSGYENRAVSPYASGISVCGTADYAYRTQLNRSNITANCTLADNNTYRCQTLNCTGTITVTAPSINSAWSWFIIKNANASSGTVTIHPSSTSVLIDGVSADVVLQPNEYILLQSKAANNYTILMDGRWMSKKANKATTIAGYGITDAKIASGTITLGTAAITPLTSASTLDATKLSGTIPSGCYTNTVYTHPTTSGNKHIPSGGSSGQFLGWSADGTAAWVNNPNINTDTLMTQNVSTTNATYPVLAVATANATANLGAKTGIFGSGVKINPSTSTVVATSFDGTAAKASALTTSTTPLGNGFIYTTGGLTIGTSAGQLYKGSSNNATLISAPENGTYYTSTVGNVQNLRLSWSTDGKYLTDIFASPNNDYLWHRNVVNTTARPWRRLVEENATGITAPAWDISIGGNAATVTGTAGTSTLAWNSEVTLYTVGGNAIKAKLPANPNTNWTSHLYAGGSGATANAATSNGGTYLSICDNSTSRNSIKITGSGATTVTSDANGVITINSTDNNTVYTHPTTSGNNHVPSGGSSGQFLGWESDGKAKWVNNPNTNTDTLMTQNVSTTAAKYPLLLCPTADATANQGAKTGIFPKSVWINPSTNEVISGGTNAFRMVQGNYGAFWRNDGSSCYFMLTASGDQYGSWTSARPITINNSTGVCSISGNAATATKLATARSIGLGLDFTGSANFDGSGNITINASPYNAIVTIGNKNNYPYHHIATYGPITSTYTDAAIRLHVARQFINGGAGIVEIEFRTNATNADGQCAARWIARSSQLPVDCIQVGFYKTWGGIYADVFYKSSGSYASCVIRSMGDGSRAAIGRSFTLQNSQEVSDTTASDPKTSTNSYATIAAAGTALHNQAYTDAITASDGGIASNVSGTVAIANGGTGATTRLNAIKALTNENVSTNATHFLGLKSDWSKVGYVSAADTKTVLGLKSAAYTESSAYAAASHGTHVTYATSGTPANIGTASNGSAATVARSDHVHALPDSGVTAQTWGNTSQQTPSHGGTFNIPYFTVSAKGIVTAAGTTTVKLPADNNTWTAMTGATSSANGTVGYINAAPPKNGYNTKFWRADGSWQVPYTHPTTSGNKHIPSGGSSGQFLGWDSDGTAKWVANPNTNTDTLMTQNVSTTNATYPILAVATANANANQGAKTGIFGAGVKLNPSTSEITATKFLGALQADKGTGSYVNSIKLGAALVNSSQTSFGTIWNAPTKSYRVGCATWPNSGENITWYSITNDNVTNNVNTVAKQMNWNAGTGILSATGFSGPLTGNVTGDVTGNVTGVLYAKTTGIDNTATGNVSSVQYKTGIEFREKNDQNLADLYISREPSGSSSVNLRVFSKDRSKNAYLQLWHDAPTNTVFAKVPSPSSPTDDSAKVATTEWIRDATGDFAFLDLYPYKLASKHATLDAQFWPKGVIGDDSTGFNQFTATKRMQIHYNGASGNLPAPLASATTYADGILSVDGLNPSGSVSGNNRCIQQFVRCTGTPTMHLRIGSYHDGAWNFYSWVKLANDAEVVHEADLVAVTTAQVDAMFA